LHIAVQKNDIEMVKLLLSFDAFIDAVDFFGNSVLYYAIKARNMEVAWVR
jgi:ankyrin repeat protein